MKRLLLLALFGTLIAVGGCGPTTVGKKVSQAKLDQVVVGTTTWREAQTILGAPVSLSDATNSPEATYSTDCGEKDGDIKLAVYMFTESSSGQMHTESQTVMINKAGVVCSIKRSETNIGS